MKRNANAFPDRNVREDPRLLSAITSRTPDGAGDSEVNHVPGGTIITPVRGRKDRRGSLPYDVTLRGNTDDGYEVTVTHGWIVEVLPGPDDALKYHEAGNHEDGDKLRRFAIATAQAIYVTAKVDTAGNIGGTAPIVTLEVAADDTESTHYQPAVGENSGVEGVMKWKLAALEADADPTKPPKLKLYLAKGNLNYYQELPEMLSLVSPSTGVGEIIKEWNNEEKAYKFRGISKGDGELTVTTRANDVEVRGNEKDSALIFTQDETELARVSWKDGLVDEDDDVTVEIPAAGGGDGGFDHPWKVTDGAVDGEAAIAAGFTNGYYLTLETGDIITPTATGVEYGPTKIVKGPSGKYAGGTLAITGTQYIYAEITRTRASDPYAGAGDNSDFGGDISGSGEFISELHNETDPQGFSGGELTDSLTLVASDDDPSAHTPGANKAAVCIAKVTNAAGEITVDDQYVTHNPDIFIPTPVFIVNEV